jgi:hypothetical protein
LKTQFFLYIRHENGATSTHRIKADEADRDRRNTDAGTDNEFVIIAPNQECAHDAGNRWVANRKSDDEGSIPDDLALAERQWGDNPWKTYMVLTVL